MKTISSTSTKPKNDPKATDLHRVAWGGVFRGALVCSLLFVGYLSAEAQQCAGLGIIPQSVFGSATRDKVGLVCGACPEHYYLATNNGTGQETILVKDTLFNGVAHEEFVTGSRTQIDPERNPTGGLRSDQCSHADFLTYFASTNYYKRTQDQTVLVEADPPYLYTCHSEQEFVDGNKTTDIMDDCFLTFPVISCDGATLVESLNISNCLEQVRACLESAR